MKAPTSAQPPLGCRSAEDTETFWSQLDTETTKQRSAVELDEQIAKIGTDVQQALPGCGAESRDLKRRTGRVARLSADDAALIAEFGRRVASRFTAATVRKYSWVLRDSLMTCENAPRRAGLFG